MAVQRPGEGLPEVPRFAVVGEHGEHGVCHVGILCAGSHLRHGMEAEVFQMGPPLYVGGEEVAPADRVMTVHLAGWPDGWDEDDREGIDTWLERVRKSALRIEYVVYPAWGKDFEKEGGYECDEATGRKIARRCSCASFVAHCYKEGAGIHLVVGEELLPRVCLTTIQQIWARQFAEVLAKVKEERLRDYVAGRALRALGLSGEGPWPVLLPGYIFHALNQPDRDEQDPYQPKSEAEGRF
jgi:hypothetical protein